MLKLEWISANAYKHYVYKNNVPAFLANANHFGS